VFDTSSSRTTVVVGYGVLAAGIGVGELEQTLAITAEIEGRTHKILDISFARSTDISQRWLKNLIVGKDVTSETDTQRIQMAMEKWFVDSSRQAIIGAYLDMVERYVAHAGIIRRPDPVPEG
jgi:hypothetical protein